jgi:hypothetical protein
MAKQTVYLMFCDHCGHPQHIPHYIIKAYFNIAGVEGVYCEHCQKLIDIPSYLRKIAKDL